MGGGAGIVECDVAVTKDGTQRIMRTSKPLEDRMDISVGPMRVEIIEPLEKLRVVVEPNDADIAMDVTWTASIPAFEEPRQYLRSRGTVVFDTQRFAQMGRWEGTLTVGANVELGRGVGLSSGSRQILKPSLCEPTQ